MVRFDDTSAEEAMERRRTVIAELEQHPPEGLAEYILGFTTVLLRFVPPQTTRFAEHARVFTARIAARTGIDLDEAPIKDIPVVYDGDDLRTLADANGLSQPDVIELHSERIYRVHLLGFSPGFPYLGELNPRLHTPRRAIPRTHVAAGSVAIGGEHTGIYSVDSPGGWHIIGRTSVPMFAHDRVAEDSSPHDVFFLHPGDRVRFVPIRAASA